MQVNCYKSEDRKEYSEIVILYIIATIFVIGCHIIQWSNLEGDKLFNYIHQIVASGVPLFLFISGFLAGQKKINNPAKWLKKKIFRILVPYYIVIGVTIILYIFLFDNIISLWQILVLGLNLQGLQNFAIINFDFYTAPIGMGHLWFTTIVVICFMLVALSSSIENVYGGVNNKLFWIIAIVSQPLFVFCHIQTCYILTFLAGYCVAKKGMSMKHYLISTILMILSLIIRFCTQGFLDGTDIYVYSVAPIQTALFGVWVFYIVFYCRSILPKAVDYVAQKKFIHKISGFSYEIYLIHSLTLAGAVNIFDFIDNKVMANIISLLVTFFSAWILKICSNNVIKKLK